jgi:asparagine synthase (glutamine-hydrolysing)
MIGALAHRGPDGEGIFAEGGAAIGMRRLAVIDLSPLGNQPMANEDGSIQVVFNGELYNFQDLRSRLVAHGHAFRSHGDTEVLSHGYEQFGIQGLVERLEGMFAFALMDRPGRRLFLVRDHFGVKPLYLRTGPRQLSFASEIRALAHDGLGSPSPDPGFIGSYLRVGYVPSPGTPFRGVRKLGPGTILEIDLDSLGVYESRYYDLRPMLPADLGRDAGELQDQLESTLHLAVRRQLVSDAPLGVFLSGGLDSSTITMIASRRRPGRLQTFSVGFERSDRGDEAALAASVASGFGAENSTVRLGPGTLEHLAPIVESLEEPLADSAVIPLWHLCRATRQHVTVALSGEGGDEALGGYGRYYWGALAAQLEGSPSLALGLVNRVSGLFPERTRGLLNLARRAGKLARTVKLPEEERYLEWFDLFTADERTELFDGPSGLAEDRIGGMFERGRSLGLDAVQRLQYVDIHTFLLDNLLLKSDKLSMAHSLEVRVPLLDRPLLELGLSLPAWAKVSRTRTKTMLRLVLKKELGRAARRPKRGFEAPVDAWFRRLDEGFFREQLLGEGRALVHRLGFSKPAIIAVVERHARHEDVGRKLFALLVLELWARRYA